LRTYLLPEPVELPYSEVYAGCRSWIELQAPVSTQGSRPALDDGGFETRVSPALEGLRRLEPAPVGF
ncbi:MAG: DUF1802 family protein, partial [Rubrobacteraceae bacterium]